MRSVVVLSLILLFCKSDAFACGDKFLLIGRGLRYEQAHVAAHPASILVFLHEDKLNKEMESILKPAGHKVRTVGDDIAFENALKSSKYDLLLVNLTDAPRVQNQIQSMQTPPFVLPVVSASNKAALKTAQTNNICLLQFQGKIKHPVKLIDQIMEAIRKGKPQICNKTK